MALAWNAGWVNALRGSNPLSSALSSRGADCVREHVIGSPGTPNPRRGMRRGLAMSWHGLSFLIAAGLYFVFVLPRWWELTGDVSHGLGTAMRIVTGAVLGLTALPVVFTLIRTRRPEFGTPPLALTLRLWALVAHVLAGVLIVGTAIAEIWLDLDTYGQWLFGVYGGAAAIAILAAVAFY